jgi:hypothetical protein
VPQLIAQFMGRELGQSVRLSIFDTHLELALEEGDTGVSVRVSIDELGRVEVDDVMGLPMLVLEDTEGILVAALRMEVGDARRAERLILDIREES